MRAIKILLTVIVAILVIDIAFSSALSYYDAETREKLLLLVAKELPPRASSDDREQFMRRHTTRYAFDGEYHHEYAGFVPQTRIDRALFDRKVQVVLKVDGNGTFVSAGVHVYYTGL